MNAFIKKNFAWFIIVFLTVVVWLQIFASWEKDAYVAKLDGCIDSLIEEKAKLKNEIHELNETLREANRALELIGKKIAK